MSIKCDFAEMKYEDFLEEAYLAQPCRSIYEHSKEEAKLILHLGNYICPQETEKEISTELVKIQ